MLVKNDQWDPDSDPARRQLVDKYTFNFDVQPAVAGETVFSDAGATTVVTALQSTDYNKANQEGLQDQMLVGPQPCTGFVMPNFEKVKEVEVRQALAYAYDYENVWSAAGEVVGVTLANGVTEPDLGFGLLPPGMAGRTPWYGPEGDGRSRSTLRSRRNCLLRPATSRASTRSPSSTTRRPPRGGWRGAARARLHEAGFKVKKYPYSGGSLYDIWTNPDKCSYKKINLLGTAWCQDWPSAATFMPVIVGTGSAYNTGNFSVPEVDDEIERIKNLPIEEQPDAWGALEQSVMTDYQPVINTGYYQNIFGFGSSIGGFANDTSVGGAPDYRSIYVKQ